MVEYSLTRIHRAVLGRAFGKVERVDIAIDCVIEDQMGQAFVDDISDPTFFELRIGPFCYFAGNSATNGAVDMIKQLKPYCLIMTAPDEAIAAARELFGEKLIQFPRYSFSSENLSSAHVSALLDASPFRASIREIDETVLEMVDGQPDHFLDISAFASPADFMARGIGYAITGGDRIMAVSYSSLVNNSSIEVSIYVEPEWRRKGAATGLGCALIKECLRRNINPHWDAANPESCALAEKLGYVQTDTYDAYYIRE